MFQTQNGHRLSEDSPLVDIRGEAIPDENPKKPLRRVKKVVAVFQDGDELEFPPEVMFAPENHVPDGVHPDADATTDRRIQVRMRVQPPDNRPSFFLPRGVSKSYVRSALERIKRGV